MAFLLALTIIVITASLCWPLMAKMWWTPFLASAQGSAFDQHFVLSMVMCALIFIPAQAALAYCIVAFKDKGGAKAVYSHGNNAMEMLWTSLALVFFIGMNVLGQKMWAEQRFTAAPEGSLQVEAVGEQFAWNFRYPGADGKFGKTDYLKVDNSAGNPLGLDPDDPAGKDDVVTSTLVVPVNRPLEMILHSKDVTHNFFVREMRIKQDAVPGMDLRIHFTPNVLTKDRPGGGDYEIACSELCGLGHYKMRAYMKVVTQQEYEQFLKEHAR
jgi:cytochrome c oxidase subunit 2